MALVGNRTLRCLVFLQRLVPRDVIVPVGLRSTKRRVKNFASATIFLSLNAQSALAS